LLAGFALATPFSVSVLGTSNIFTAGGNANPATCCNSNGSSTGAVLASTFAAAPGQTLTITSATGSVGCSGSLTNGPDGSCFNTTNQVNSLGVIASNTTNFNNTMYLVGVFLDNGLPGALPAQIQYTSASQFQQASYAAPLLGQVFFIGDGLTGTGSGAQQTFAVPTGATRLFLGFEDAFNFSGTPDFYGDNPGSLSISGNITGAATGVPEPASFGLAVIGLLGIGASAARKRKPRAI